MLAQLCLFLENGPLTNRLRTQTWWMLQWVIHVVCCFNQKTFSFMVKQVWPQCSHTNVSQRLLCSLRSTTTTTLLTSTGSLLHTLTEAAGICVCSGNKFDIKKNTTKICAVPCRSLTSRLISLDFAWKILTCTEMQRIGQKRKFVQF